MKLLQASIVTEDGDIYQEIEHQGLIVLWFWRQYNANITQICVDQYAPDDVIEDAYEFIADAFGYTIGDLISLTK